MADRSTKPSSESVEDFLESVWGQRFEGLPAMGIDVHRPVTHRDIEYLLSQYPYIQMINPNEGESTPYPVRLVKTKTGWVIHDYGDAMSTSPGELLYGPGKAEKKDEAEGGGDEGGAGDMIADPGSGTIVKQTFDMGQELIALAKQKGWSAIYVVSGTPLMTWSAWLAAKENNVKLDGYNPSKQDKAKGKRVEQMREGRRKGPGVERPTQRK